MKECSVVKRERVDDGAVEDAVSSLMNMKETAEYFYGPKKNRSAKDQQLRLMALLCTIKTTEQVAKIFGVGIHIVQRARRMFRDELKDASISRNNIIAGMAERKAIEALQGLNVNNVDDDKKGRLIKDLMESAGLAEDKARPPKDNHDEDVTELVLRVRTKMARPRPVDVTGDIIDAEVVEQGQIPEKNP